MQAHVRGTELTNLSRDRKLQVEAVQAAGDGLLQAIAAAGTVGSADISQQVLTARVCLCLPIKSSQVAVVLLGGRTPYFTTSGKTIVRQPPVKAPRQCCVRRAS